MSSVEKRMARIQLYVILSIIGISMQKSFPCSSEGSCICCNDTSTFIIFCSNKKLAHIPKFPSDAVKLFFQNNLITRVNNMAFQNLNKLLLLDLSRNKLKYLEADAFIGLKKLKELILQNNTLIYNKAFSLEVLKPLKSLVHLNVKFENDYVSEKFPDDVISFVTSLEEIEIDIPYPYPFGSGFKKLKRLRKLQAGHCSLYALGEYVLEYMKYLEYIDLSTCYISYYRSTFKNRKPLQYLELGNPTFYENYVDALVTDLETTSIKTLIMTNLFNNISTFPTIIFRSLNNTDIREISMKSNRLRKAIGNAVADSLPSTLESIDLSNNEIKEIKFGMSSLIYLNMRNNLLGDYLVKHSYTTSPYMKLKEIDLSENYIYELKTTLFNGHTKLQRINLSKNYLQELSLDLSDQSNLIELDLSNNYIKRFSDKTINYINEILKKSDLKINLLNNTFECSCLTYSTLTWISENIHHFLHSENYKCQNDDGTIIALNNIKERVDHLAKACTSHTILIICIIVGLITVCFVTAIGLVYRYRWKLRYIYYMTRSKYSQNGPLESDVTHSYDAFISYSDHEKDFILEECIPHLEEEGHFRLCIHQRDFIPGEEIAANITNAVHESRKIICIITRSFLDSYYCMFEFNMARVESIYSRGGQNILLLVFKDQILPKELPLVMLEIIKQDSYIEYPNDEQGNIVFWAKMKEAITAKDNT